MRSAVVASVDSPGIFLRACQQSVQPRHHQQDLPMLSNACPASLGAYLHQAANDNSPALLCCVIAATAVIGSPLFRRLTIFG